MTNYYDKIIKIEKYYARTKPDFEQFSFDDLMKTTAEQEIQLKHRRWFLGKFKSSECSKQNNRSGLGKLRAAIKWSKTWLNILSRRNS